jgi:hypothetical protein
LTGNVDGGRQLEHAHEPVESPEQDAAIAESALWEGDLPHAAFHIGCALASDPARAEWRTLLERILATADDPLDIVPDEDGMYFATAAVRAYALASLGRHAEAIPLLIGIAVAKPEVPYLSEWGLAWLDEPGVVASLDVDAITAALATLTDGFRAGR